MTEEQMAEDMARALFEAREVAMCPNVADRLDWSDAYWKTWVAEARAALVYIRAHASEVCRLFGGAGPEEVERAKRHLVNIIRAPRDFHVEGDLIEALAALRALGGKEPG